MEPIFDPRVLQRAVQKHLSLSGETQTDAIARTLHAVYGDHVHPGQPWMWSNAGGIMCAINVLHVSLNEYLLFCGTAIGSAGHSGRHRAEIFDVVMGGELWTYRPGPAEPTVYKPGDLAHLPRDTTNGSRLHAGCWLLEYARGNVASMFPFALGDTLFSTLDTTDLRDQLGISTRMMASEALLSLKEWRAGGRPAPNLAALEDDAGQRPGATSEKTA